MANRHNTESPRRIDPLDKTGLNQIAPQKFRLTADDVITSLANAPENRRARQVSKWERIREHSISTGPGATAYR